MFGKRKGKDTGINNEKSLLEELTEARNDKVIAREEERKQTLKDADNSMDKLRIHIRDLDRQINMECDKAQKLDTNKGRDLERIYRRICNLHDQFEWYQGLYNWFEDIKDQCDTTLLTEQMVCVVKRIEKLIPNMLGNIEELTKMAERVNAGMYAKMAESQRRMDAVLSFNPYSSGFSPTDRDISDYQKDKALEVIKNRTKAPPQPQSENDNRPQSTSLRIDEILSYINKT